MGSIENRMKPGIRTGEEAERSLSRTHESPNIMIRTRPLSD
jgi:hypothetical protein